MNTTGSMNSSNKVSIDHHHHHHPMRSKNDLYEQVDTTSGDYDDFRVDDNNDEDDDDNVEDGFNLAVEKMEETDDVDDVVEFNTELRKHPGDEGRFEGSGANKYDIFENYHRTMYKIRSTEVYHRAVHIMKLNLMRDGSIQYRGHIIIEHSVVTKLLKFMFLTFSLIGIMHSVVRIDSLNWEHDTSYTFEAFQLYDLHSVMLDTIVFFIVGRLCVNKGVDHLGYVIPLIIGMIYPSWTNDWGFLRHSVSMYEIICRWPAALFEYVLGVVVIDTWLLFMHLRFAHGNGILLSKGVEIGVCLLVFLAPVASDPNFHLHHWFAGWLIGMHASYNKWWSRATQAFLWGMYINGIAVYGRDHILGCSYSYFAGVSSFCNFMSCNLVFDDDNSGDDGEPVAHYQPFVAPDWHNCSSG